MKKFGAFVCSIGLVLGCSNEKEEEVSLHQDGIPFTVTVILQDAEDSRFYQVDLMGGDAEPSSAIDLTSALNLDIDTRISNIYQDAVLFETDSGEDFDMTFLNVKSHTSHNIPNYLDAIGAPNGAILYGISNNQTQLFSYYYNSDMASTSQQLHIGRYDLNAGSYEEVVQYEYNPAAPDYPQISMGQSDTGISASNKFFFIKYDKQDATGPAKQVLDIYDANSLQKVKTFSFEPFFGCVQDENDVLFLKIDEESNGYNELYDLKTGRSRVFNKMEGAQTLEIYGIGQTIIRDGKIGMATELIVGPEPMIMDFNSNQYRYVEGGYISGALENNLSRIEAWNIELKNEIAVVAYSTKNTSTKEYGIAFVNFKGEVLYQTTLSRFLPKRIIIH